MTKLYELSDYYNRILPLYDNYGIDRTIHERWSITIDDFSILAHQINRSRPSYILELGTFLGVSTFLFAQLIDDNQHIYSVDPNLLLRDEIEAVDGIQNVEIPNVKSHDVARIIKDAYFNRKNIHFYEGCLDYDSAYSKVGGLVKHLPEFLIANIKFDFVFIDALHVADAVLSDLRAVEKIISSDGAIFLHDGIGRWADQVLFGVCKFFEACHNFELIRFKNGSIIKLQRKYERA